ncbi:MAG: alpha/beta fold hydrolase, partial [Candidatus Dormibacteraceae bacterium]
QHHPHVRPEQVFLGGHSLGGTAAPRIATHEPSVAGLVILAGGTQPLQWAIVRQLRYLASLDPATAVTSQPAIDAISAQARLVDSPDLSISTPTSELPFGIPAPYWLDLRAYNPVDVAAKLDMPMLIAQGGRDYQATVAEDLARWKAGLEQRPGISIRVYPADNHFFFPGTRPSAPTEYEPAQHMDSDLIADIASWLTTTPRPSS